MKISFLTHAEDTEPQPFEVEDLEHLGETLEELATDDGGTTAWIAGETLGRTDAHVQAVSFWVLDFDGVEPPWERLEGWRYIAHTSRSHMRVNDKHPEPAPCWRVIVDIGEPYSAKDWKRAYKVKALMHDLKVETDGKTCNPARIWFAPRKDAEWRVNLGGSPALMPSADQLATAESEQPALDLDENADGLLSDGSHFKATIERLMRSLPPSISGQGGDDRLFEAACYCRSSLRLTPEASFEALKIFNERCQPPWPDDRLWYKVQQAAHDKQHAPGELIPADAKQRILAAAKAADPALAERLERTQAPAPAPTASPFTLISAAQLAEPLGPVQWLVRDLGIAPGRPTVFVGYAGSGKTLAAQELALSVASGEPAFCGRMAVDQGSVLHIDVDQGRRATAARYQLLAQGRALSLASLPIDLVVFQGYLVEKGEISNEAAHRLGEACVGRRLCIIDSLRGIAPGLDENSSDFGGVLQVLTAITDATQCAFLVVHHEGKPSGGGGRDARHAGRGSSAIQDRAGAVWRLVQDQETKTVEWVMTKISEHDTEFCKPFVTKLLPTDGGGLLIRAGERATCGEVARANVESIAAKLVTKLRNADRWMSRNELLVDVAGKAGDKQEAIAILKERGTVGYKLEGSKHHYHWNPKMQLRS